MSDIDTLKEKQERLNELNVEVSALRREIKSLKAQVSQKMVEEEKESYLVTDYVHFDKDTKERMVTPARLIRRIETRANMTFEILKNAAIAYQKMVNPEATQAMVDNHGKEMAQWMWNYRAKVKRVVLEFKTDPPKRARKKRRRE